MKESDLYPVLEEHFQRAGCDVKGEVCGCDLVALHEDGSLIIVEIKLNFNARLLYQAIRRLRITQQVYVAVPKPKGRKAAAQWSIMRSLCRRLHLGLILIDQDALKIPLEPAPFRHTQSKSDRERLLKEFRGRRAGYNQGGIRGEKIETAYLESSIHIAVLLSHLKKASAKTLRSLGTSEKSHSILYKNHYGWFVKKEKGIYALKRGKKKQIRKAYPKIWGYYENESMAAFRARDDFQILES